MFQTPDRPDLPDLPGWPESSRDSPRAGGGAGLLLFEDRRFQESRCCRDGGFASAGADRYAYELK